jgi:surface protein
VIQGGSLGGLGWWSVVCNLMNVWPSLGCLSILTRCFPPFLFLCVDFECNRDSLLATVFSGCYEFNGDLNQWDVAEVTTMERSKSIRILEKDFDVTCAHAIAIGGFSRGLGLGLLVLM